jgi:hypothetical protein
MNRMRMCTVGCLALMAISAPALGAPVDDSTYVPGRTTNPAPYSARGTAVRHPTARGGGPQAEGAHQGARTSTRARTPRQHTLQSDNQTRRPGAINYNGRSFKGTEDAHGIVDPTPVNVAGDHFESHTGANTTGRIAQRAPSSNERDFDKRVTAPEARGGGPIAGPYVVAPGGTIEMLAPSRPLVWSVNMPRVDRDAESPLTRADLRYLPRRGDGTAVRKPGLLAMTPDVTNAELIDTVAVAGVEPSHERSMSVAENVRENLFGTRAMGGGPRTR